MARRIYAAARAKLRLAVAVCIVAAAAVVAAVVSVAVSVAVVLWVVDQALQRFGVHDAHVALLDFDDAVFGKF